MATTNRFFDTYIDILASEDMRSIFPQRIFKGNLKFYLNFVFQDISFAGKSMLDVGGGSGFYSFYGAYMGARPVVCIEPELAGSTKIILDKSKQGLENLESNNVMLLPITFQELEPSDQTFDIILLHNSINHLDEEACIKLQHDDDARNKYKSIFQKLSKLSSSGAKLIICDCSPHNFFPLLHVTNPFAPSIEWEKHQSPGYWSSMLQEFGFFSPRIRWTSPDFLRVMGRLLLGNRFASYFLQSHFCLVMNKR